MREKIGVGEWLMVEDMFGVGQISDSAFRILKEIIDLGKYVYEEYSDQKSARKQERDRFLSAASEALRETLRYLGRDPYVRDAKEEEKLSDLWARVASAAYPFNPDLAQRCYLKGNYWANPERWTDGQLDTARIRIGEMEEELGKLFGGKKKDRRKRIADQAENGSPEGGIR